MYLAIRTASTVSGGKVISTDKTIVGIELSTDIPSYVTADNEYVYVDLSSVDDMEDYVNSIINNLGTAVIIDNPGGVRAVAASRISLGGSKTDRYIDDADWDSSVPQAWVRALTTVNFTNL